MTISSPSSPGLAAFARGHQLAPPATSSRVIGGALTLALYGLLVLLAGLKTTWKMPDHSPQAEVIATMLPEGRVKKILRSPLPFVAHLIRPHILSAAPPAFTVASDVPAALATLAPTKVQAPPIAASLPIGLDAPGQGISGEGLSANGNGNGAALAGCWDKEWAQAVSDRIRKFFYYPRVMGQAMHPWEGVAMVRLVVRRNGRLEKVDIYQTSGHTLLDYAAVNMVRKAQPLPPIPERMHVDRAEGLLPIKFGNAEGEFAPSESTCK